MKTKLFKKKQKGIAERKTETHRQRDLPYKAVGLGILLWLFVTWLFFGLGTFRHAELDEGNTAPTTIVAAVDFECEVLSETARKRTDAADAVPKVFSMDPLLEQKASKDTAELFSGLQQLITASSNDYQQIESSIGDLLKGLPITPDDLVAAFPSNSIASTQTILSTNIVRIMSAGVMSDAPDHPFTITTAEGKQSRTVTHEDVQTPRAAIHAIASKIEGQEQQDVIEKLLGPLVVENLTYDETTTDERRRQAADMVAPVIQEYTEGTSLINAGEIVSKQTRLLLKHHTQQRIDEQDMLDQMLDIVGNGVLLLAGLVAVSVILRVVAPRMIRRPDQILLLIILSLTTLGLARLFTYLSAQHGLLASSLLTYLVPHTLAVLLAGILLSGPAAICLGLWTSFATAVLFNQDFTVFALGILITITATSTARNVHRRSSLFQAGVWVCVVKVLFALVSAILDRPNLSVLLGQIAAAIVSGMLATVLVLLLIPVFEKLFKITTDITLLELSDMGHPLLQKMAMQAPGTYHHSLMVATLSQNAAEAIGANPLLIRVCAYYHDIGKMAKPEFFTENIQHKENPHDELSPHMSALVISSHVKEGLALARRHKLPQPILDAIEQHHGNGLISYFYHKAKQMQGDGKTTMADVINDSDFRYGGAPAVTPEMAILSLADAAEASARSIEKPTPQKISNMMDDIFAMKIRDGQLDYANLTMAEIVAVKESFIFSLSNMLHGRIPYPKDHENNIAKPTNPPSAAPASA